MNKKIKLICTLLVVAIIGSIVINTCHVNYSTSYRVNSGDDEYGLTLGPLPAEFGTTDSIEGGVRTDYKPTLDIEVYVRPQNIPGDPVLLSKVDGQTCKVEMQKVKLMIPADQSEFSSPTFIIIAILLCTLIPMAIWLLVIIFRIIKSIRKGEVFVTKTAGHLAMLGKLLIGFCLYQYLMAYAVIYYARQHFALANYDIVMDPDVDTSYLIMGLVLILISHVILMGKELKEEQELTI